MEYGIDGKLLVARLATLVHFWTSNDGFNLLRDAHSDSEEGSCLCAGRHPGRWQLCLVSVTFSFQKVRYTELIWINIRHAGLIALVETSCFTNEQSLPTKSKTTEAIYREDS